MASKRKNGYSFQLSLPLRPLKMARVESDQDQVQDTSGQEAQITSAQEAQVTSVSVRNSTTFLDLPLELRYIIYAYALGDMSGTGLPMPKYLKSRPTDSPIPPEPNWREEENAYSALLRVSKQVRVDQLSNLKLQIQFEDSGDFITSWFGRSLDPQALLEYSGQIEIRVPINTKRDRRLVNLRPLIDLIRAAPKATVVVSEAELDEFLHSSDPTWLDCLDNLVESIQALANFEYKTAEDKKTHKTPYPPTIDIRFKLGCELSWMEQNKVIGREPFKSFMASVGLDHYQRWGFRMGFSLGEKVESVQGVNANEDWGLCDWVLRNRYSPSVFVRQGDDEVPPCRVYW
ncbi:hypothetical protein K491DRAFT_759054 [Lophiostoma macrostomum CBS 122681]|uniref:Uncharacterized protein n=1 Tax=Lophiostoma macrostomum CBS 122681 TaxID=1314788 RepID=A0A6A6T3I1_9PLEO|nr:hypothetical protein K491DRAFT_759054 [Lophiostoma macrostomum CBS 122681]